MPPFILSFGDLFTDHAPGAWTGSGRSDFDAQISTLEAEAALGGHGP
ncbi:MAG: hypothetical protein ABIW76_05620 [Fibrobacteria bacterium]